MTPSRHQRVGDDTEAKRQEGRGSSKAEEATPHHPTGVGTPLGTGPDKRHGTYGGQPHGHPPDPSDRTACPDPPHHRPSEPLQA